MTGSASASRGSERLKWVNQQLQIRYEKEKAPIKTSLHDQREHDKTVVVHRLDAALADVQSKLSDVKAQASTAPPEQKVDAEIAPHASHKHHAAIKAPTQTKTSSLRDALEQKLNDYRSDPGSMEALREHVIASQQKEYLRKLLEQPSLNYVALNRAAAHDPYAFINTSDPGSTSNDSEAILTTALSRVPPTLLQPTALPETSGDPIPENAPDPGVPPGGPKPVAATPHMSYNVAKLLEIKDTSATQPSKRLDVRSRTYGSPGCGGSPTALPAFQAALTKRAAKRSQHTQHVHSKHVMVLDKELERRRAVSARSAQRTATALQAREEAAQLAAMHERARPWMILVHMCWRLALIQDAIILGRAQRKHAREREHAATLIQRAWRSFELGRRNKQMVHTVREARRHLEPRVPRMRERCRQRCACRIITYLKDAVRVGRAQACIMRVQQQLRLIQRTWKSLHAVRHEQAALLMSQLLAFEGKAIAANRRRLREKPPAGAGRKSLPSESSKGTVTSDSPVDAMNAVLRDPLRADSLSLPETCSAEWTPKIGSITQRVANQYKLKAVREVLKQRRSEFVVQVAQWQHNMKLYVESAKLDQMRVRLLQEAGISNVECQVLRPLRPCMRVVASPAELKELLLMSHQFVLENARQKALVQREKQDEALRKFLERRQDLVN